jgi:HK97 family phage major capsid protein
MEMAMDKKDKEAIFKTQYRNFTLDTRTVKKEDRTVSLSFSSETPVRQRWGMEILSHDPGAVDLSMLNRGGALLVNHNTSDQVGVCESAVLGNDRRCSSDVRFGKSARAEEIFQDVVDGIRKNVSVGYEIIDIEEIPAEKMDRALLEMCQSEECKAYRVTKWLPKEITIATIPADSSVGVGRGRDHDDTESNLIIQERTLKMDEVKLTPEQIREKVLADQRIEAERVARETEAAKVLREKNETERVAEIEAVASKFSTRIANIDTMKADAIALKVPAELFRGSVYSKISDGKPLEGARIDLTEKEKKRYSVSRAIMHMLPENQGKMCLEREISNELAKRIGKETAGMFIDPEAIFESWARTFPNRLAQRSTLVTTTTTLGGNLVGTQIMPGQFIDLLRNRMKTAQAGVTMLTGLQQNCAIPKQSAAGSAYWVADNADLTGSNPTFGQVSLSPHNVGAYNDYSRQLLLQSTPSIDGLVVNDLVRIIALAIDAAIINGSGSAGQPTGILNWPSLTSNSDASISWTKIVAHESDVATANADVEGMGFMITPANRGKFKTTAKIGSTYPVFLMDDNNTMAGYPCWTTNQMPANTLLFGDWSQAVLAEWGLLSLLVDPYTGSKAGTVRVVAFESVDVGVRQVGAFSAGTSIS